MNPVPASQLKQQQKEWLIKGGLAILVSAICLGWIIFPVFKEAASLTRRIASDRELVALSREVRGLEKKVAALETPLASWTDRAMMMSKMSDLANEYGIDVQNIVPKTVKEGAYVRLGIDMQAKGSFFSFLEFLKKLETIQPPILVKECSFSRDAGRERPSAGKRGTQSLNVKLLLESYLKPPRGKEK